MLSLLAALALAPQTPPVRVERSRDTIPTVAAGVSTSLDTNGSGNGRTQTPIDAERAFATDAQMLGQWTAFAKWSTDEAVMFVPQPTNAHAWLKDRKDPLKAIDWWPTASYVSCDGKVAVNTGGWKRPDGSVGYFSTVWQQQPDGGWKWVVDGGNALKVARPRPVKPKTLRAYCGYKRKKGEIEAIAGVTTITGTPDPSSKTKYAVGGSKDDTLTWLWMVLADGSRRFMVSYWNGRMMVDALDDKIAPK